MPMSPQDIADLKAQGWTDQEIANAIPAGPQQSQQGQQTIPQAIGHTLVGNAGGIIGGGAGSLGAGLAGARTGALLGAAVPVLGESGIGEAGGALIGGTIGALGGGYAGQRVQQGVENPQDYAQQQLLAQQAAEQHPIVSGATDIAASALASGGSFSPSTAAKGLRGIIGALRNEELDQETKHAAANVILQSAINPAINSGVSYATTGQLPTATDLASQAVGGALFAKPSPLSKYVYGEGKGEVTDKATPSPSTVNEDDLYTAQEVPSDTVSPIDKFIAKSSGDEQRSLWTDKIGQQQEDEHLSSLTPQNEEQEIPSTTPPKEPTQTLPDKEQSEKDIALKLVNGGHVASSDFTAEGIKAALGQPSESGIRPLIDNGLVTQSGDGTYKFNDNIQKLGTIAKPPTDTIPPKLAEQGKPQSTETKGLILTKTVGSPLRKVPPISPVASEAKGATEPPKGIPISSLIQGEEQKKAFAPQKDTDFVSNAAELIKNPKELGLQPNRQGAYNGTQLLGTLMNKLPSTEQAIYKSAGIEQAFSGRMIHKDDAIKWLQDNAPQAKTVTYGMEGKVSEAKKEYDKMTHEWYENLDQDKQGYVDEMKAYAHQEGGHEWSMRHINLGKEAITKELRAKAEKYATLKKQVDTEPDNSNSPRATSAYSYVSALPTNEPMPEWTTTKSGKNVQRVDVVVPGKKTSNDLWNGEGKERGTWEKPLWQPDNLHENLPNTLGWAMIQYKTGAKGEKIAVIAEAQSRWGQSMRERKQELANTPASESNSRALQQSAMGQDHPLLHDYNRLILKAAIEQARKEGATHIMVSDAETAMMTEGHDTTTQALGEYHRDQPPTIPQEPGMRLHYDTILPKIAEELTGSKGERVSLGKHKNAYVGNKVDSPDMLVSAKRSNLIFHNPDGTPKTDVSGRMYSIIHLPDRPPKLMGKTYSPASDYNRYNELVQQMKGKSMDEAQPLMKELEAIKNRNGGNPPPIPTPSERVSPFFGQSIINGRATVGSTLHSIAQTKGHEYQQLAHEMLTQIDTKSAGVRIFMDKSLDNSAGNTSNYDPRTDTIHLAPSDVEDVPIIMHELGHAALYKKLPPELNRLKGAEFKAAADNYLKVGKNESVKEIIRSYYEYIKHEGLTDKLFSPIPSSESGLANRPEDVQAAHLPYQASNIHEFTSQLFNSKKFISRLNELPSGLNDGRSLWSRLADAFRKLLGVSVKSGSLLERTLKATHELVGQERPAIHQSSNFHELANDRYAEANHHFSDLDRRIPGWRNKEDTLSEQDKLQAQYARDKAAEGKKFRDLAIRLEQGEGGQLVNAPKKTDEEKINDIRRMGKLGGLVEPVLDRVRELPHKDARYVADQAQKTLIDRTRLRGKYGNAIAEAGRGLSKTDLDAINKAMENNRIQEKYDPSTLTPRQRKFYDVAVAKRIESGKELVARKVPVMQNGVARLLKPKEGAWSTMANQQTEELFRQGTNLKAMQEKEKEFVDFYKSKLGYSKDEAQSFFDNWKRTMQGDTTGTGISHQDYFNAIRKAQGEPLPPSFREQNPVKNEQRYYDRMSTAAAHYTNMESNHRVMSALGATKDAWGNTIPRNSDGSIANSSAGKAMLAQFHTTPKGQSEHTEGTFSAVTTALLIARPGLEAHKLGSNFVKAVSFQTNPITAARTVTRALSNLKSGYQHAVKEGLVKLTATSVHDMFNSSLTTAERLQSVAQAVRSISTFGGLTTKLNAAFQQSYFENVIPSMIQRARSGNLDAQQFMKKLDPDYARSKIYTQAEQQSLASDAASYVHGTGDIRQLPGWMMNESEVSGFFQLAHWSVAQTNNFFHDVWTPATRGSYAPLLTSVFGSVIGGYMIKELRQKLQGQKNQIPSLQEIAASDKGLEGNKPLLMYNAIAAMQYSGFGGLLSQVAKYPFDFAYKNTPQGATFPLDTVAEDILGTVHSVSEAIANDPNVNWVDLASTVANHVFREDVGLSHDAINLMINNGLITGLPAEKKQLGDKMNQLRRFDMVEGLPYNDIDEASNPYMNLEQKQFKMEQDPQKAIQELPPLINNIIHTYGSKPDVMMEKLKALKQNAYTTFPSMEDMPLSFMKYVGYLQREEGPQAAQNELQDYIRHKVVNEAKASVVP